MAFLISLPLKELLRRWQGHRRYGGERRKPFRMVASVDDSRRPKRCELETHQDLAPGHGQT